MVVLRQGEHSPCYVCPLVCIAQTRCLVNGRELPDPHKYPPPAWCPLRAGPVTVELEGVAQ